MGPLTDLSQQARDDTKRWFPDKVDDLRHMVLGLAGEAGEVANLVKKFDRGDFGDEAPNRELAEEVVDVLVYAFNIFSQLGVNPDVIYATKRAANERRFGRSSSGTERSD